MSAELGGAYFLSSLRCMLVVPRANHSFQHVFRFSRRRLESVCVCVCVCDFLLTFAPFSSIFRLFVYTHVRTSSSWSRRCVCWIVSQGAPAGRYTLGNPRATFEFPFCE